MTEEQAQKLIETMEALILVSKQVESTVRDSIIRFDETVDSLADELIVLSEQVNQNTQEIRLNSGS
jgi:hypothetical protein